MFIVCTIKLISLVLQQTLMLLFMENTFLHKFVNSSTNDKVVDASVDIRSSDSYRSELAYHLSHGLSQEDAERLTDAVARIALSRRD